MKKRRRLNIIRKYYLDKKHNFIILCILCFDIIYLMKLITPLEEMLKDFGIIATTSGITFIALVKFLIDKKQIEEDFYYSPNQSDKKDPLSISRNTYLEKLRTVKGCFFVLGESGSGKSHLLNKLEKQLDNTSTQCVLIKNNYFESWQSISDAKYIIFDQFEKILNISEPKKRINFIKSLNDGNRTILLSIRKEYFAEIYKMFEFHGDYLWVDYTMPEKAQIITQLYNLIGEESIFETLGNTFKDDEQRVKTLYSKIENNEIQFELTLLKQIILDVIENKILFIQLSYLGKILQQDNNGIQQAENDWEECKDYNILIMRYIEKKLDNFMYSDLAYLIVFLLCQDTKGIYANTEDDFENISMQSEENIRTSLGFLEELQLVSQIKSDDKIRSLSISQYEISHEYIFDILLTLCNSKLDFNIRNNIIFYNREYQSKRNEYSVQKKSNKNYFITERRKKYVENNDKYLYVLLCCMLFTIIGINVYTIWFYLSPDYKNTYFRLCLTNITSTVSTYYIFNYYHYFMRIFERKYWIGVILAMVAAIISYLCADYWVIGYGCEILVVGIIMFCVSRKIRISEKNFFKDRCRNFCGIGLIVIVMSLYYYRYTNNDMTLAWPCYFLYASYMLLGIIGHINKPYILALLGKVLYKDREEDFK